MSDAIRIVPLRLAEVQAASAAPHLTYRDGPLLTAVDVVTVFWGDAWQQAAQSDEASRLNTFFDTILTGPLIDALAEYSVPGKSIGRGSRTGSVTLTTPAPPSSVTDTAIQALLQQNVTSGGSLPAPTANTLYFLYLPAGTTVSMGGGRSCLTFCGYHNATSAQLYYAVMPYPSCTGCLGAMDTFDALTVTSSHELCEAITDPVPGSGWYDDANGEIGDICAWQTETVAGYTVQREWSNQRNACNGASSGA